jgi:hypothetical protein
MGSSKARVSVDVEHCKQQQLTRSFPQHQKANIKTRKERYILFFFFVHVTVATAATVAENIRGELVFDDGTSTDVYK